MDLVKNRWGFGASVVAIGGLALWLAFGTSGSGQGATGTPSPRPPSVPLHAFDWRNNFPHWPLPPDSQAYGRIDGKHLKEYVNEFAAIGEKYRDAGHAYWGRISGSEADTWNREWLMAKLKAVGVQDVRDEPMDLTQPQWFANSWEVKAIGRQTMAITSAQPYGGAHATPTGGIDVEPVWVGLGSKSDFLGRDVRGKAAVIFVYMYEFMSSAGFYGGVERAAENGAAAILVVNNVPGNLKFQNMLNEGTAVSKITVPVFSVGKEDGEALRVMMESGPTQLHVALDAKTVLGLKSGNVWGTLPGKSKEEIVVLAHRDGFFDGAGDNASGVAAMLGLAEYFAKVPQDQRPRTIKFLGSTGHHQSGLSGPTAIVAAKDKYLSNAVFLINLEHVAWTSTTPIFYGIERSPKPIQHFTTSVDARRWYVYGSDKVATLLLDAFKDFGVGALDAQVTANPGEGGPFSTVLPNIGFLSTTIQMHSDADVPDMVPANGLESATRATARIITELSKMPKADLAPRLAAATGSQQSRNH